MDKKISPRLLSVLRIRDVFFLTQKLFLNSRKYYPGFSSRILILIFTHPRSRIRIRNTDHYGQYPQRTYWYYFYLCGCVKDASVRNRVHHRAGQPQSRDPPGAHRERHEHRQDEFLSRVRKLQDLLAPSFWSETWKINNSKKPTL